MSTKAVRTNDPTSDAGVARVDMKFEVVVIPVSDVDRAKDDAAQFRFPIAEITAVEEAPKAKSW